MNKATEILDVIMPVLIEKGMHDFEHGFYITEGEAIPSPLYLGEKRPSRVHVNISDFPKLLDTKFFSNVIKINPLTAEDRFKNGTEIVSVKMGPDVVLNKEITLYSITLTGSYFYSYSQSNAKQGVEVLPAFISEGTFKPFKRIMVTIDLEAAQDAMNSIIGTEFMDNIPELEQQLTDIVEKKNQMVRKQQYEESAKLRDAEKHILSLLEQAKKKRDEPVEDKLARIKERTNGSFIENIARMFSEKLSSVIVNPNICDVEEYTNIFFRMTPDSFEHAQTRLQSEMREPEHEYFVPKSYVMKWHS